MVKIFVVTLAFCFFYTLATSNGYGTTSGDSQEGHKTGVGSDLGEDPVGEKGRRGGFGRGGGSAGQKRRTGFVPGPILEGTPVDIPVTNSLPTGVGGGHGTGGYGGGGDLEEGPVGGKGQGGGGFVPAPIIEGTLADISAGPPTGVGLHLGLCKQ